MSEVTAVPLRPMKKGSLVKLWAGIAILIGAAGVAAFAGTERVAPVGATPEAYLAWNARQPGVVTTASGLQYKILEKGEGTERPTATDYVLVAYEGRLRDGTVFDKNERAPLELSQVIPGWTEGLQLMPKGAKYRFWIPPQLGYGDRAAGDIPPGSDLEFDVTLIDFLPAAVVRQQMMMQGMGGVPGGQ